MPEPRSQLVQRLQAAERALSEAASGGEELFLQAGAILEKIASALPPEFPEIASLLRLTLDTLQAIHLGELSRGGAVEETRVAVEAMVESLADDCEAPERRLEDACESLRALLGRGPQASSGESEGRSGAERAEVTIVDRVAALVSAGPDDTEELAELAGGLMEQAAAASTDDKVRAAATRAAELIAEVIDGAAKDPQQALDEAASLVHAMADSVASQCEPFDCESEQADSFFDDEPACLQFEGDAALLAEFVAESMDHIDAAEVGMLAVEADPHDREAINAIFRGFHTIKGTAGFLGLDHVQKLAHRAESMLDRAREGEIQLVGGYADLALSSSDLLREMLCALGEWDGDDLPAPPPGYERLMQRLEAPEEFVADAAPEHRETAEAESVDEALGRGGARQAGSTRVRTDRLDALINMVGELVIANAMLAEDEALRAAVGQDVERKIDQVSKITRELQDVSMSLRMVPLGSTFNKMARVVRDVARKSHKQIELVTEGEDTEIDRNMVESITDPLMHMVRNAADHGIEPPNEREEAGKPPTGTVTLRAYHSAGRVVIEIIDDGRGLDHERIYQKAVAAGEIDEGAQLADEEVYRLIFSAGLSTAQEVTDVSGRGVGMDVVRRNIEAMRGRIEIASSPGQGSNFSIRIPLTLAIIDGMLMRVGDERYILPTVSIQQAFRPTADDFATLAASAEVVSFRGVMIPLLRLRDLFELAPGNAEEAETIAVVIERDGEQFALLVDELLGQQQIVIKSLGEGLAEAETVAGAAILGDGSVGLILDVDGMVRVARKMHPSPSEVAASLTTGVRAQ